jgi:hypothetical protein
MAIRAITHRDPRAAWVALAGAAVLVGHVPSFVHRLMDGDEAIYGSVAVLMNGGAPLYAAGGVDNKPPGIFWVYAGTFEMFGRYQMTAVHAVALLVVFATCGLLFVIGLSLAGPRAGLLAALFYGVMTGAGNPRLLAANTELFMTLPLTASVLLMLRRRWLWSGTLIVAACAFKQVAAVQLVLLPFAVLVLQRERWVRAVVEFGAGVAAGLVLGGLLLAVTGSPAGFWRWTVQTLYGYATTNWTPDLLWMRAQDSVIPFVAGLVVLWVAALALVLRWRRLEAAARVAVVWFVVSGVGSIAGGHLSWHYFIQVMAPLAVLAALAVDGALRTPMRKWVAAATAVGVGLPAIAWLAFDLTADPLTYDWSPPIAQHELVSSYIRDHTQPGDRVFVWGDWPALYVESDRVMSSRFPGFLRGFTRGSGLPPNNWDTAPDVWPELRSDLESNPPKLIVDTAPAGWSDFRMYPMSNYPALADFVAAGYRPMATVDGVVIYVRQDAVAH